MSSAPSLQLPVVHLKIERRSSHPWIFQKMVEKPSARIPNGAVVEIRDKADQWVGLGFYNGHVPITAVITAWVLLTTLNFTKAPAI